MKKLLLAVLIAVSCVAFAPSYAKAEGGPTMGLGINFDVGYGANKVLEILDKNGMGYGANVFFNYFFTENFALAANFDYIQYTPTADKDFVLGCAALLVGLKVVLPLDALKVYGEADVGYSNWRIEYDNVEYGTSSNRLAFQFKAGINYFFSDNWALNANFLYFVPNAAGTETGENIVSHIGGQVGVGYFF